MNSMDSVSWPSWLAGSLAALIWMALGTLVLSGLLAFTALTEAAMPGYILLLHTLALLIGGWTTGRRSGRKGWLFGGWTGLAYAAIVLMIGHFGFESAWSWVHFLFIAGAWAAGAMGGVIGVQFSRSQD